MYGIDVWDQCVRFLLEKLFLTDRGLRVTNCRPLKGQERSVALPGWNYLVFEAAKEQVLFQLRVHALV